MATTFADLVARVRGQEARTQRAEEDITAIIDTVSETHEDVRVLKTDVAALKQDVGVLKTDMAGLRQDVGWTKRAVQALLDHNGVGVEGSTEDGDA